MRAVIALVAVAMIASAQHSGDMRDPEPSARRRMVEPLRQQGSEANPRIGHVALQSEGVPAEFRNTKIRRHSPSHHLLEKGEADQL